MSINRAPQLKIAVFGSAFNPPSLGHKSVIESLAHFDKVLLVPSIAHAWGKEMADYAARCEMVDLFIRDIDGDWLERSDVEEQLHIPGEGVTTFAVLEALERRYPGSDITFIVGPDNFFSFANFYRSEEILTRWNVLACPERVKIRSTHIREQLVKQGNAAGLTTPAVEKFLTEHNIYSLPVS